MAGTKFPSTVDVQLILMAAATLTASANGNTLDLGNGYAPEAGGQPVQAVVQVSAVKTSATNETYVFTLQDSPDGATWRNRSPSESLLATGGFLLSGFIENRYVRVIATLGGTAPSITFGDVYLNPIVLD
jgi:hypothetical protein